MRSAIINSKNIKRTLLTFLVAGSFALGGCGKKITEPKPTTPDPTPTTPTYTIPTTYDFGSNTNLNSSVQRVAMLKELVAYVRSTHNPTTNITITASKLNNMYTNTAAPFTDATALGLNTSGINLKDKTDNLFGLVAELEGWYNEAATVSQGTATGSDGVAGKVLGPVPTSTTTAQAAYLLNASGFEYKELIEKGAMGGILYAQAATILKNIASYDNSIVVPGQGTAMEHAWDEAFGYFGVPVSFPTSTTGLSYWGSYCNSTNVAIGSNATIMNAWLKGRAAISNKDDAGRNTARDIVLATWEKVGAARFITYMKQAKTNFANDGQRSHALSEGYGFIRAFRYNTAKTISDADINALIGYMGSNFYQITLTNIDNAINKMATVFALDASKL